MKGGLTFCVGSFVGAYVIGAGVDSYIHRYMYV